MPKAKTNKGASQRFKVTSKGKLLRRTMNSGHLKRKKTRSQIRRQNEPKILVGGDAKRVERLLGLV